MTEDTLILALDMSGMPNCWITAHEAIEYYAVDKIESTYGSAEHTFFGGKSRFTGERTFVTVNSIIAIKGALLAKHAYRTAMTPTLSNRALFARDKHTCAYCGEQFQHHLLTRDHVVPRSFGGKDIWKNVVTACKRCNNRKGNKLPMRAGMPLLFEPFAPNRAEYLLMTNSKALPDQKEFLCYHISEDSRLKVKNEESIESV